MIVQIALIRFTRSDLDDRAEETVPGVGVAVDLARGREQRRREDPRDVLVAADRRVVGLGVVAPQARRVGQELMQRDAGLVGGHAREEAAQRVGGVELPLLFELENRGRGELLGDRAQADEGMHVEWAIVRPVAPAVAPGENNAVTTGYQDPAAEAGGGQPGESAVEPGAERSVDDGGVAGRRRLQGQAQRDEDCCGREQHRMGRFRLRK